MIGGVKVRIIGISLKHFTDDATFSVFSDTDPDMKADVGLYSQFVQIDVDRVQVDVHQSHYFYQYRHFVDCFLDRKNGHTLHAD